MISTNFIADLRQELAFKIVERDSVADQLSLIDVQIDKYDVIISNMDKSILPQIQEINSAITSVKSAYDNRISIGCKSNLYWEQSVTGYVRSSGGGGGGGGWGTKLPLYSYTVKKDPALQINYGGWGLKYYRRPLNQDYGANIVTSFDGALGGISTNLAIIDGTSTATVFPGDIIVDNIENPTIFAAGDLPRVVSVGTSTLQVSTVSIAGSISEGSASLICFSDLGDPSPTGLTTVGVQTGSSVSLPGVISYGTTVIGVGETSIYKTVWDATSGNYISSAFTTNCIILSLPAEDRSINGPFSIGINSTYPSFFLSTESNQPTSFSNFTVIRDTQGDILNFDYTNNPVDPVTIGIMNSSTLGYGHTLVKVNSTAPPGPVQWHEVQGSEFAPEPEVGAGAVVYSQGNNSWPVTRSIFRFGAGNISGQSAPTYAAEGTTVQTGGLSTSSFLSEILTGTANVSAQNPSSGTCNAADAAITSTEASRDALISKYESNIDTVLESIRTLRNLRDKLEVRAFALLQARTAADAEIIRIKRDLTAIRATDFTPYEPPANLYSPAYRYSSSTVGFASTGT